jgi:hypothetical protein
MSHLLRAQKLRHIGLPLSPVFGVNDAGDLRKMSKDDKRITRGRFAGKKITFASTERIEDFGQLASDFMGQVFDFLPGEYLISDESDLLDFTDMDSSDTSEIWKRITEVYGVSLVDVESERLVNIFTEITRRRNLQ